MHSIANKLHQKEQHAGVDFAAEVEENELFVL
jgi:hypothetical protein